MNYLYIYAVLTIVYCMYVGGGSCILYLPLGKKMQFSYIFTNYLIRSLEFEYLKILLFTIMQSFIGAISCSFQLLNKFELGHEKMCHMSYANNKGTDQTAHLRSLISAFAFRCLYSIISLDSVAEISRL